MSVSFLALVISTSIFNLSESKLWPVYASLVAFTVAYGILAFILFKIGV